MYYVILFSVKKYLTLNGKQIEVKKALSRSEINNSRMGGGPGYGGGGGGGGGGGKSQHFLSSGKLVLVW